MCVVREGRGVTRAALWVRVSTNDQEVENQRRQLQAEADRRGFEVVTVYSVIGSAYTGEHNRELNRALADAVSRRYDVLLTWSLDRLTRQGIREALNRLEAFRLAKVDVVSLREPWLEMPGELRSLITSVIAWAASFESSRKSERIKAALDRRRAAGLPVGRQPGAVDKAKRRRSGYYRRYETGK